VRPGGAPAGPVRDGEDRMSTRQPGQPAPDVRHTPGTRAARPAGRSRPDVRTGLVAGAVVVALLAIPWVLGTYAVITFTKILIFAVLAMSVNLLTGVAGLPTLGQAAYFGVGAYAGALTAIHLSELGIVQILVAVVA